jgi:ankyrin repeat protein
MDHLQDGGKSFTHVDAEGNAVFDPDMIDENDAVEALTFAAEKGFQEYLALELSLRRLPIDPGPENKNDDEEDTSLSALNAAEAKSILLKRDRRGVTPLHVLGCQDYRGEDGTGITVRKPKARGGRRRTARDFCGRRRDDAELPPPEPKPSNRSISANFLITEGADVFSQTTAGLLTPLHCQCYYGHIDVVKSIVESSSDPFLQTDLLHMADSCENLPLHIACLRGKWKVCTWKQHGRVWEWCRCVCVWGGGDWRRWGEKDVKAKYVCV